MIPSVSGGVSCLIMLEALLSLSSAIIAFRLFEVFLVPVLLLSFVEASLVLRVLALRCVAGLLSGRNTVPPSRPSSPPDNPCPDRRFDRLVPPGETKVVELLELWVLLDCLVEDALPLPVARGGGVVLLVVLAVVPRA